MGDVTSPTRSSCIAVTVVTGRVERKTQINLWYLILAMLAVIWVREAWIAAQEVEPVAYSDFLLMLEQGKVNEIQIREKVIQGTLKEPLPDGEKKIVTTPRRPSARAGPLPLWSEVQRPPRRACT